MDLRSLRARALVVPGVLLGGVTSALAAPPQAFTDAISDATTDGVAMATALLGVAAAIVLVMVAVKFIKRIRGVS